MTNKKFLIGMPVLLIAALFFLGCPTDSDDGTDDSQSGGDTPTVVYALALDAAVGTPVLGAEGKLSVDAAQYSGPIVWTPGLTDGKFAAKQPYTATVTLTAKPGFTFEGVEADSFIHDGAASVTNGAGTETGVTVTVVFPPTAGDPLNPGPVDALDLSKALTEPVAGAAPGIFTSPDSTQYTGGAVSWEPALTDGKFAGSVSYTAAVTLTAGTGYTFTGAGSFTYGTLAVTKTENEDGTVTVAVAFGPTEAAVTYLDLTNAIAAPATGAAPVYVFTSPSLAQYDGGDVTWDPPVNVLDGAFAAGTVYKASVTLAAVEGYTFAGAKFTYAGATAVLDGDVVTVTFGATDAVVNALNLTALIPAPAKNNPVQSAIVDGTQFSGQVTWKDTEGKPFVGTQFGAATVYTATAVLAPLPGFTFTGFEGAFFYNGLQVVEQTQDELTNTVTVVLTFTDTDDSESWLAIEFEPVRVVSSTGSLEGIVLVKGGEPVRLTAAASSSSNGIGTSAKWYLDGNPTALKGTKDGVSGNTLTLNPANYSVRENAHHVTVTAKADGKLYSVTVPFTVAAGN
jgi:hypothetical protein